MRIILFTGKGGVGKTTIAAASALRSAELGHKTIVVSTDAAHSLADSFDVPLSGQPVQIAPNLWGQETDIYQTIRDKWGIIQDWLTALMTWRGINAVVADEMAVLPGMQEMANLLYIVDYCQSQDYDLVVVDCAPTGETLQLLSFPEVLRWWMQKLYPIERTAARVIRPIVRPLLNIPIPDDMVFQAIENLFRELEKVRTVLSDSDITSVRLVVNAEKMVIKEAQRTFTYLSLYGYSTDLVICNRLIPEEVGKGYFDTWREGQKRHLQTVEEGFSPIPVFTAPLLREEVTGVSLLRSLAREIYQQKDPTDFFFRGQAQQIMASDGSYVLVLKAPFVTREDISLTQNGDELYVQIGAYRRSIFLPRSVVGLPVKEAKFEDGELKIRFEPAQTERRKRRSRGKPRRE